MHESLKGWHHRARHKIIAVTQSDWVDGKIHARIITEQFGVRKEKPYEFDVEEYGEIIERGYV